MNLLERDTPLLELRKAYTEAAAGNGRVVLISGEAGIGKTSLVEQFVQTDVKNWRQLWGACDDLFTPRPLGPLHDIAGQARGELLQLLQGEVDRAAIFAACLNELQTPTVLVVEDIHWADEATLDLLKFLGRRIQRTCSLLIATYRDDELGPRHPVRLLLGDLVMSSATRRLVLSPLSIDAVRHLAGSRAVDAATLHRLTDGNPFFITEVLAAEENEIPPTVRDAVLARAARLSPAGRAVLDVTAVIGPRVEPWLLAAILQAGTIQAAASAVDESLALGILLAQGESFAFRHELSRQTILDAIPPHQRIFLHQAALNALIASPVAQKDVTRLAHHAEGANDHEAIITYAPVAAGEAAALGMHRAAAALFELALRHADELPLIEQIELHEAYGRSAQAQPGRTTTIAAYRRAAELAHQADMPLREGYNLARLAGVLEMADELAESERVLAEALAILEPRAPNRGLVDAYKNLAYQHLKQGETEAAVAMAEKSHAMAQWTETSHVMISSYQMLGLCWLALEHRRGCAYLEQCLAMALDQKDYWTAGAVYPNLSMIYTDIYELGRAEQLIGEGIAFTAEHDIDLAKDVLLGWQAVVHLHRGRWHEAQALAGSLLQKTAIHPYAQTPARLVMGRLLARQGEPNAAQILDEALAGLLKTNNRQRLGSAYTARAEAAWLADDPARIRAEAAAFYDEAVQNRQPGFAAELAYWRWRAGDEVATFDWMVQPFVLQIQGDWRGAAAAWEALGCPYEQARALAEGNSDAQLVALGILEQLGARRLADHVRQALRDAGVQAIPRGPRPTTKENPFNLTNRQLDILMLLVDELTNGEIGARLHITPKTVDHHVSAILAKLDVPSREAAAELARQHPAF
jgi:DNA-binding CsgD family transcriptional regulator